MKQVAPEARLNFLHRSSPIRAIGASFALCAAATAQDCAQWQLRSTAGPAPREAHEMVYDAARGVVLLFGGYSTDFVGDTWTWDGQSWTELPVAGPSPRAGHAMAYDSVRDVVVLHGGITPPYNFNAETWEWDGQAWSLRTTDGPSPRGWHNMAFDSARGVTVLFGGAIDGGKSGETWEWDGAAWQYIGAFGPAARQDHVMAYDSQRGVTVLHGGAAEPPYPDDETWEWDGEAWTFRTLGDPSLRNSHVADYDPARGITIVHGGSGWDNGTRLFTETWAWDGNAWTMLVNSGPSPRAGHAMAFDTARDVPVLFGGYDLSPYNGDTWELSHDLSISQQPADQSVAAGERAEFAVAAGGADPLSYQWRRDGLDLMDGGPISGAASPTLAIDPVEPAHAGRYDVVVTNACGSVTSRAAELAVGGGCRADLTGDGELTLADFVEFRNRYVAGDLAADFDDSGTLTLADFVAFRNAYVAGCS